MKPPGFVGVVVLAAAVAGCGSGSSSAASGRIESCVDRLVEHATAPAEDEEDIRRHARETYCSLFERNGWVYEDGALRIDAQVWLDEGASCASASEGKPARTVLCEEERRRSRTLDCALLHHVRQDEVGDYLERLRLENVECDDGTPLGELGVPDGG